MKEPEKKPDSGHDAAALHSATAVQHSQKKSIISSIREHPLITEIVFALLAIAAVSGFVYWQDLQGKVYIEKAEISAPIISLGPRTPGIIEKFYVQEGDEVTQGQKLALVGNETIESETSGIIIAINDVPGQLAGSQDAVVKMVDPREFTVIGRIQEDKGLKDIRPGQRVIFTVDAYDGKQYAGTVESVAMSSRQSDIVFSISDKREEREFEVKATYDTGAYPELKNGMSAKMWVYK